MAKTKPQTDGPTPKPGRPDAVKIPVSLVVAPDARGRLFSVTDLAEPILQPDKINGERVWARRVLGDSYLATRAADDTEYGAIGTPEYGQPRYHWTDRGDGVLVGRLREPAEGADGS